MHELLALVFVLDAYNYNSYFAKIKGLFAGFPKLTKTEVIRQQNRVCQLELSFAGTGDGNTSQLLLLDETYGTYGTYRTHGYEARGQEDYGMSPFPAHHAPRTTHHAPRTTHHAQRH